MDITPTQDVSKLRVTRRFKASRQRVYRAWTEPELIMKWLADADYNMRVVELDLQVGGRYRYEGEMPGGSWAIYGEYLEVRPPERLVYTWKWDEMPGHPGAGDTVVTVDFREQGSETEIVLTHEGFTNETDRREHNRGWIGCFDKLAPLV